MELLIFAYKTLQRDKVKESPGSGAVMTKAVKSPMRRTYFKKGRLQSFQALLYIIFHCFIH